ncbi:hypothetical protein B0H10DRAFT_1950680 [Mycena sp. CBHHK59/15]|nr:hypothetical protein B0H10DRAFT_1950680 [Mycena sp. CBHHK59/15]
MVVLFSHHHHPLVRLVVVPPLPASLRPVVDAAHCTDDHITPSRPRQSNTLALSAKESVATLRVLCTLKLDRQQVASPSRGHVSAQRLHASDSGCRLAPSRTPALLLDNSGIPGNEVDCGAITGCDREVWVEWNLVEHTRAAG